jgi:hypothetical protein
MRATIRVERTEAEVADAALRLIRLMDRPDSIPILQGQLIREMHYWLLIGRHGGGIRALGFADSHAKRIARAVGLIRNAYAEPLPVERLADAAGMSPSSFHQRLRAVTSLSPLQYQKQLRLIEARRMKISEGATISNAACGRVRKHPTVHARIRSSFRFTARQGCQRNPWQNSGRCVNAVACSGGGQWWESNLPLIETQAAHPEGGDRLVDRVLAFAKVLAGRWRIVEMDHWDNDVGDLVADAHRTIVANGFVRAAVILQTWRARDVGKLQLLRLDFGRTHA